MPRPKVVLRKDEFPRLSDDLKNSDLGLSINPLATMEAMLTSGLVRDPSQMITILTTLARYTHSPAVQRKITANVKPEDFLIGLAQQNRPKEITAEIVNDDEDDRSGS